MALGTIATIATIASAGASIIGQQRQARSARRSRAAQEQAARVQNRQATLRRQRSIRQALAQSRVRRAQAVSAGFGVGAPGASGVAGAVSGIQSDVGSAVGFSGQQFGLEQSRVGFLNQAANFQSQGAQQGALFGGISGIAGIFSNEQNLRGIQNLF